MTPTIRIILNAPSSLLITETEIIVSEKKAELAYIEAILTALEYARGRNWEDKNSLERA